MESSSSGSIFSSSPSSFQTSSSISNDSNLSSCSSIDKIYYSKEKQSKGHQKKEFKLKIIIIVLVFIIVILVAIVVVLFLVVGYLAFSKGLSGVTGLYSSDFEVYLGASLNTKTNETSKFYTRFENSMSVPPNGLSYFDTDGTATLIYPNIVSTEYNEEYECSGECTCCVECMIDNDCEGWQECDEGKCMSSWDYWRRAGTIMRGTKGDSVERRNPIVIGKMCYDVGRIVALILATKITIDNIQDEKLGKACDGRCKDEFLFANSRISSTTSSKAEVDSKLPKSERGKGVVIIDVRTRFEYKGGHVLGAVNIPVDDIFHSRDLLPVDMDTPIIVYCAAGVRAQIGKGKLETMGYTNVKNGGGVGNMLQSHDLEE